jgi:hypothetical protein
VNLKKRLATPIWGVLRYEFLMQIRRIALWIALGLAMVLILFAGKNTFNGLNIGFKFQLIIPLVAGYFLSDRLYRDFRLGTSEILNSSVISKTGYLWGKYAGIVGATSFITLLLLSGLNLGVVVLNLADSGENLFTLIGPALIVTISAYLFVGAFCMCLPAILPLRLFQILFSAYWLWAFQSRFPSVANTPLSPTGQFPLDLLFRDQLHHFLQGIDQDNWSENGYYLIHGHFGWVFEDTPATALLNQGILIGLAILILVATRYYLGWKELRG